jgi:Methylase involved in ubiquinone/menaquinone biosynthesis
MNPTPTNPAAAADRWLESPLGAAVLELETRLLQHELSDVVGFELLQVGQWGDADVLCAGARTQHRALVAPDATGPGAIRAHYDALPIATNSVEAVLLPHTLEHAARPHQLLREVERILVGEGSLVICAFSPWGPWGARHFLARGNFPPHATRMLSERRTRDWLSLLGFEIVVARRYLFAPPWTQGIVGLRPDSWLEAQGPRLAPPLAGAYLLKAKKRVHAVTPIRPAWTSRPVIVGGAPEPTTRQAA